MRARTLSNQQGEKHATFPGRIAVRVGLMEEEDAPELGVARRLLAPLQIQEVCMTWLSLVLLF